MQKSGELSYEQMHTKPTRSYLSRPIYMYLPTLHKTSQLSIVVQ